MVVFIDDYSLLQFADEPTEIEEQYFMMLSSYDIWALQASHSIEHYSDENVEKKMTNKERWKYRWKRPSS